MNTPANPPLLIRRSLVRIQPGGVPNRRMAAKKTYGMTLSGRVIDDELIEELAAQAECGYDVGDLCD